VQAVSTSSEGGITEIQTIETIAEANNINNFFRLTFLGETTSDLRHDSTASEVQAALTRLSTIGTITVVSDRSGDGFSKRPVAGTARVHLGVVECISGCQYTSEFSRGDRLWAGGDSYTVSSDTSLPFNDTFIPLAQPTDASSPKLGHHSRDIPVAHKILKMLVWRLALLTLACASEIDFFSEDDLSLLQLRASAGQSQHQEVQEPVCQYVEGRVEKGDILRARTSKSAKEAKQRCTAREKCTAIFKGGRNWFLLQDCDGGRNCGPWSNEKRSISSVQAKVCAEPMDAAEAVGDPHMTTITNEKLDMCCDSGKCKPCA